MYLLKRWMLSLILSFYNLNVFNILVHFVILQFVSSLTQFMHLIGYIELSCKSLCNLSEPLQGNIFLPKHGWQSSEAVRHSHVMILFLWCKIYCTFCQEYLITRWVCDFFVILFRLFLLLPYSPCGGYVCLVYKNIWAFMFILLGFFVV